MAAIRVEHLSKTYRTGFTKKKEFAALRDLSLEVKEGEIFGFLGPNGAGKTTSIHLILDLIRPTSGAAYLFDQPTGRAEVRRRLGFLPETINLHEHYTGRGLLQYYAALANVPKAQRAGRIDDLLKLLKLESAANRPVAKFSKGMQQRLGFAQALIHDPDLVILDEPTASLDPVGRKEFRDILVELKQRGKTVFISSHILSEVESVCDRVAIMAKGALVRLGTLKELSTPKSSQFVVRGVNGALLEALSITSAEIGIFLGETTIKFSNEETRMQVEAILAAHQVVVQRNEVQTQSLEEIFFSAINSPSPSSPPS